jgi:uncharacterized protein YjeT (DUF2065 family)
MTISRVRVLPELSQAISHLIDRLFAMDGQELTAAVARIQTTGGDPRALEIAADFLVHELLGRDAARNLKAARVLELLGPVAAPHLARQLFGTRNAALRLRLVGVLAAIGPAAREVVATSLLELMINQPDATLRAAAWAGLMRMGPPGAAPNSDESSRR